MPRIRSVSLGGARRRPLAVVLSVAVATVGLSLAPIAVSSASATTQSSLGADVVKDVNAWRATQGAAPIKLNAQFSTSLAGEDEYQLANEVSGSDTEPTGAEFAAFELDPGTGNNEFDEEGFVDPGSTSSMALEVAQEIEGEDGATTTFLEDNYAGVGAFVFNGRWFADFDAETFTSPLLSASAKPHVTITGTAKLGGTLTAHSSIKNSKSTSVFYIWLGGNGESDSSSTYTVTSDDIGLRIYAVVGVESNGHSPNDGYAQTSAIPIPSATPGTGADAVTVTGDRYEGHTLTVNPGTWTPSDSTFTYQWYRDNYAIQGATDDTYTQVPDDVGHLITVRVFDDGEDGYLPSTFKTTTTTKTGGPTITNTTAPSISGTDTVGQTLTADPGVWDGTSSFTYQWLIGGVAVSGATKSTFVIPTSAYSAAGKTIAVAVTDHETGFSNTTVVSAPTPTIAGLTFTSTTSASYTGTDGLGDTLEAVAPNWTPAPTTVTYSWTIGATVVSTKKSFTIPAADAGDTITLEITPSKAGYVSASSTAADIVVPAGP